MNKAFEKIIDELKQESIIVDDDAGHRAVEIIEQIAEEYNNGWIACSERLPEEYTVLCCDKYGEIMVGHPYFDEASNTNYSAESDNEMIYNCVAWQPLPELYKESD